MTSTTKDKLNDAETHGSTLATPTFREGEFSEEGQRLAKAAEAASLNAIKELHAAGIPAVYMKDRKLIRLYPDGHEEVFKELPPL